MPDVVPTETDVKRFAAIAIAEDFDGERDRLYESYDSSADSPEHLIDDIGEGHIPRYMLLGGGCGMTWGTAAFTDDLELVPQIARDLRDDNPEDISAVYILDLDDEGKRASEAADEGVYFEDDWSDGDEGWDEEDDEDDDFDYDEDDEEE